MEERKEEPKEELNPEKLEAVSGGKKSAFGGSAKWYEHDCPDPDNAEFVRTGREREDPTFFGFFSQHQYEYRCTVCGKLLWKDEERNSAT